MKFERHVKRELRNYLQKEYKQFIKDNNLTKKEKDFLYEWVIQGNSVYDNPINACNAYGEPLDYLSYLRLSKENGYNLEYDGYSDEFIAVYNNDEEDEDNDYELPFY